MRDMTTKSFLILGLALSALSASGKEPVLPPDLASAAAAYDEAQVKGDGAALTRLLAEDYTLVSSNAHVYTKAQFIADSTAPGSTLEPFVLKNVINRVWGDGAVLSGEVELKGTSEGKPYAAHMRFADIWRKRGGEWRVVFTEVTLIPR
jgi:ketosteroid isomerase-like protein